MRPAICLLCVSLVFLSSNVQPQASKGPDIQTLLFEAESFQFPGGWRIESEGGFAGGFLGLRDAEESVPDAQTVIRLPEAGVYSVWTRSKDHDTIDPGARRFRLYLNGEPAEKESGGHKSKEWVWERVMKRDLESGEHMLTLHDSGAFFARCDAILCTMSDLDPNEHSEQDLAAYRTVPVEVDVRVPDPFEEVPPVLSDAKTVARLENDRLRILFQEHRDAKGNPRITRTTEIQRDGRWETVRLSLGSERLFLLHASDMDLRFTFFPKWTYSGNRVPIKVGGKTYAVQAGRGNPFLAGKMVPLMARSCRQVDGENVSITFSDPSGREIPGRWRLLAGRWDALLSLTVTAPENGFFSVGFSPFQEWPREKIEFAQLPPLYQYQRLPQKPLMATSSMLAHPMASLQVQPEGVGTPVCFTVSADPDLLPFRWASFRNALYGFSLLNFDGEPQPSAFSPVLGLDGSEWAKGETHEVGFRVVTIPGDWKQSLEYYSDVVMGVTDYRRPIGSSLTDAALNIVALLRDTVTSGFDPALKGYWNIEYEGIVTQAAPLAPVSAAILSRDETLFAEVGLPCIAYTLTRTDAHFGRLDAHDLGASRELTVASRFFGTAYWQGLEDLLGGLNPWMHEFAMPEGKVYHNPDYGVPPRWSDLLAAYRLNPTDEILERVVNEADDFIQTQVYGRQEQPVPYDRFANVAYYPYWWDLLDLYDLTGERRFIDAAEEAAFHTLSAIWSHPMIPDGEVTIHPAGKAGAGQDEPMARMWYRGYEKFRMGYPRRPGDTPEKRVPAWQVAQIGMGIENPNTYFRSTDESAVWHIMMTNWAPHLLRLWQHTGRNIFRTYARNAIIGRFANYPGYYLHEYTDIMQDPRYPLQGPDLTDFYYHHIPVHFAFTVDYLMAQAEARSGGKIHFPYVRQQNYVWFTNRIFGPMAGKLYDEEGGVPWLENDLVEVPGVNVDWLAARSKNRFWLILMSQSRESENIPLHLNARKIGLKKGAKVHRYEGSGRHYEDIAMPDLDELQCDLPPLGLVALSFATDEQQKFTGVRPLKNGHQTQQVDETWGALHCFRIRTPFGKDAVYLALSQGPDEGGQCALSSPSGEFSKLEREEFPYEFILYPVDSDRPAEMVLRLKQNGNIGPKSIQVNLPAE
ncbi:hypothetical protein HQ520_06270 [bacterium]|nr:hypothetical protein [bacterium]